MRAWITIAILLGCLLASSPASATRAVTIKMVLNNAQAKTVRASKGEPVTIKLTNAQKSLIRVRAPKFQGHIIRVSASELSSANKLSLTIFKPGTTTPVLRVEPRGTAATDETSREEAMRNLLADIRVETAHMQEKLASYTKRLATVAKRLRRM